MEVKNEIMNFMKPWAGSDSVLVVQAKKLHVHRVTLALHSPVFDKMFKSKFKENRSTEIELVNKKVEEIKEMLEVLYNRGKEITESNFHFLMALADEYQMFQLRFQCTNFVKKANKTGCNAIKFIGILQRYNERSLKDICLDNIKYICSKHLTECNDFQQLGDKTKFFITLSRVRYIEEIMKKYKSPLFSLLLKIYESANNSYTGLLRDKGYEETVMNYCENEKQHKDRKADQEFNTWCRSCRERMKRIDEFTVKTEDVCDLMDELYTMKDKL